jgi:hypothetical protein
MTRSASATPASGETGATVVMNRDRVMTISCSMGAAIVDG